MEDDIYVAQLFLTISLFATLGSYVKVRQVCMLLTLLLCLNSILDVGFSRIKED